MFDSIFTEHESNVRSYCRDFPEIFESAKDSRIFARDGKDYIDFLMGAGSLNYGHNPSFLQEAATEHLLKNGIIHGLDFHTTTKADFISTLFEVLLNPRQMDYKVQFTGPTGANAVEAALKLARKVTGRRNIVAFTNAYHGMSLGALAATTNPTKRQGAGVSLDNITFMPFDGYLGDEIDTGAYIEKMLAPGSGIEPPAAFLVETIQGEGGINVASQRWLQKVEAVARRLGALLIVDDIQAGCGRTGTFFSFETMNIQPDLVCISKSISGLGLPMSLLLIHPMHDQWAPGEHNGTFRGNNLAFLTATRTLERYWVTNDLSVNINTRASQLERGLRSIMTEVIPVETVLKGRSLMRGLSFSEPGWAQKISAQAFDRGLIVETCGHHHHVLKFLPALTISSEDLDEGMDRLRKAVEDVFQSRHAIASGLSSGYLGTSRLQKGR